MITSSSNNGFALSEIDVDPAKKMLHRYPYRKGISQLDFDVGVSGCHFRFTGFTGWSALYGLIGNRVVVVRSPSLTMSCLGFSTLGQHVAASF
ncbi:hypothetical protein Tco_1102802 [Tanacetum coccineum]